MPTSSLERTVATATSTFRVRWNAMPQRRARGPGQPSLSTPGTVQASHCRLRPERRADVIHRKPKRPRPRPTPLPGMRPGPRPRPTPLPRPRAASAVARARRRSGPRRPPNRAPSWPRLSVIDTTPALKPVARDVSRTLRPSAHRSLRISRALLIASRSMAGRLRRPPTRCDPQRHSVPAWAFTCTDPGVHVRPIPAFRWPRSRRSNASDLGVQVVAISAFKCARSGRSRRSEIRKCAPGSSILRCTRTGAHPQRTKSLATITGAGVCSRVHRRSSNGRISCVRGTGIRESVVDRLRFGEHA
jgi:hypothetical protein